MVRTIGIDTALRLVMEQLDPELIAKHEIKEADVRNYLECIARTDARLYQFYDPLILVKSGYRQDCYIDDRMRRSNLQSCLDMVREVRFRDPSRNYDAEWHRCIEENPSELDECLAEADHTVQELEAERLAKCGGSKDPNTITIYDVEHSFLNYCWTSLDSRPAHIIDAILLGALQAVEEE